MKTSNNPYEFSNPVYRENEFFNRRNEIDRIMIDLNGSKSIQLVGQYRIGKSSLLYYIKENVDNLLQKDRLITVYYDIARRPSIRDGNDFYARLWRMLSQALVQCGQNKAALPPEQDLNDAFELNQFLEDWTRQEGYSFLVLLDEFRLIATDQDFDLNFFDNLRSDLNFLTFIFATPSSLSTFTHNQARSSPLWNMLDLVQLRAFEDKSTIEQLIRNPMQRVGLQWTAKEEDFIYDRGGQHPCYIQLAAWALYNSRSGNGKDTDFRSADQVFRDNALQHFRYLWTKALDDPDLPERTSLLRQSMIDLVRGKDLDETVAEDLYDRGLIWLNPDSGSWEPLSVWFAEWLRRWSTEERNSVQIEKHRAKVSWPVQSLNEGEILDHQYQIQKLIGDSENSLVAKAWDLTLKRTVGVKFLRLHQKADDENMQRLQENLRREASILAEIDHPNIGKVYTFLLEPPAIIMEWIEGVSLEDVLDHDGKLSVIQLIQLGIELADALKDIHWRGIYHRDIKPSNIILTIDPRTILKPVLIDFGIARSNNRATISLQKDGSYGYVGTRPYSAPEQFLDPEGVGAQTDVFSLGLVMYELLTHQDPFPFGNLPSQYSTGSLPRPGVNGLPEDLHQVLCEMLSQYPDQRPNAESVKRSLQKCLDHLDKQNQA